MYNFKFIFFRTLGFETCKLWLNIPFGYQSTEKYNGTFGHKANHNFNSNMKFTLTETARYEVFYYHFVFF